MFRALMIGLAIAVAVYVLTAGHVVFLPLLFLPLMFSMGGGRRSRRRQRAPGLLTLLGSRRRRSARW